VIIYLATLSISAAFPLAFSLAASFDLMLAQILIELQAQLGGLTNLNARLALKPPGVVGTLSVLAKVQASIQASASLTFPSVTFALDGIARASAALKARIASINVMLDLAAQLSSASAAAGVDLFIYQGTLADLDATLSGAAGIAAQASVAINLPVFIPVIAAQSSSTATVATLKILIPS